MSPGGLRYEQFRPGTMGFEQGAVMLGSHFDEEQRVLLLGVKRAAGSADDWDIRFRASRACEWVTVHVQSDATGGRDYSAGSSVSSVQYDMRVDRQREVEVAAPSARYVFLVPEFEESDGTYTKFDGADGDDHMVLIELDVGGNVETVSMDTVLDETHHTVLVDASGGNVTITLPAAASYNNTVYAVKKIDASANTVTIDGNGAETIDGAATAVIAAQNAVLTIKSDATEWWII